MSETNGIRRRDFIGTGLVAAGALAFGPGFWRKALAAEGARLAPGPYGELMPADANGLMLPKGFTSRIVARANQPVPGTTYRWPFFPDGKASYATPDGGYIVVVNSEARAPEAGSSAIRFDADGEIQDAYRILGETNGNCAGGPTPWGTWLSCEEIDGGQVWECDPTKESQGTVRPALGTFNHEAVAVDPAGKRLYLTEDKSDGGFYRFTPRTYPDLSEGLLEVAIVDDAGRTTWAEIPDPAAVTATTRTQVPEMREFGGGEGIWFDSGIVYFATKGENRVYAYDTVASLLTVVYDEAAFGPDAPLSGLDNVTVSSSGDLFVCEDGGDMDMGLVTRDREVTRFFKLTGPAAMGSEIAGVIFDPSGTRLYFSSQRGLGAGITYEISGPFRLERPPGTGGPAGVGGATQGGSGGGAGESSQDGDTATNPGGNQGGSGSPPPSNGGSGSQPQQPQQPQQPPPAGGGSGEDADAPGLRIRAPRRVSLSTLRDRGLPVTIDAPEGASLSVALRTNDLDTVPGNRGSVDRPELVYLGRGARRRAPRSAAAVRVRVGPKAARRLRRRRSVRARVTVLARTRDGRSLVATRMVRIRVSPR